MDGDHAREPGVDVRFLTPDGGLHDCDVLRYQHLDRVTLDTCDIALASDHGRELRDDVTA